MTLFKESVMMSVGKDIASFLSKFSSIQEEITKVDQENGKKLLEVYFHLHLPVLPSNFSTKKEIDEYNLVASQINMVINEKIDQIQTQKVEFLKMLKDFLSFLLIEKQGNDLTDTEVTTLAKFNVQVKTILQTYAIAT